MQTPEHPDIQLSDCETDRELFNKNIKQHRGWSHVVSCLVSGARNADTNVIVIIWDPWYYFYDSVLRCRCRYTLKTYLMMFNFENLKTKMICVCLLSRINFHCETPSICFLRPCILFDVLCRELTISRLDNDISFGRNSQHLSASTQIASLPRSHSRGMLADTPALIQTLH